MTDLSGKEKKKNMIIQLDNDQLKQDQADR